MMKFARTTQGILILLIGSFLMIAGALSKFAHVTDERIAAAAFFAQGTATPVVSNVSEIGSTDGIVLMGVIIVIIVAVPIMLRRKSWSDH